MKLACIALLVATASAAGTLRLRDHGSAPCDIYKTGSKVVSTCDLANLQGDSINSIAARVGNIEGTLKTVVSSLDTLEKSFEKHVKTAAHDDDLDALRKALAKEIARQSLDISACMEINLQSLQAHSTTEIRAQNEDMRYVLLDL